MNTESLSVKLVQALLLVLKLINNPENHEPQVLGYLILLSIEFYDFKFRLRSNVSNMRDSV